MTTEIAEFKGQYFFLSNFFPQHFYFPRGGDIWTAPTVEHAFQALKSADYTGFRSVMGAHTARDAKKLGRSVDLRPDWETVKYDIMKMLVELKFAQLPVMQKLVFTDKATLIEGNTWHDNIWGNCTCGRPECEKPGNNWLGQILMSIRGRYRLFVPA